MDTTSSRLWDLIAVSKLNSAFVREMVLSNDENQKALSIVDEEVHRFQETSARVVAAADESVTRLSTSLERFSRMRKSMDEFTSGINEMERRFLAFRNTLQQMDDATGKIGATVDAIENISSLTNLLALNAAIEAARAGEHGRGFKVVANEVKKLADESQKRTEEISGLLSDLHKRMASTLETLSEYEQIKNTINSQIETTVEDLDESNSALTETDSSVREIAGDVRDQKVNVDQITEQVGTLSGAFHRVQASGTHVIHNLRYEEGVVDSLAAGDSENRAAVRDFTSAFSDLGLLKRQSRVIYVGHDLAYPPWCYVENGRSVGISVDILNMIAEKMSMNLVYHPGQFEDVANRFFEGKIDLLLNVGWPNAFFEGKPVVATGAYATFEPVFFVERSARETTGTQPLEAFDGKRVAYQQGSYVEECMGGISPVLVTVENDIQGIAKLIWGQVDAVATERFVGQHISRKFFQGQIEEASSTCVILKVVMLFLQARRDLRDAMNDALGDAAVRREIDAIINRYAS